MLHEDYLKLRAEQKTPYEELQFPGGEHYRDAIARAKKFLDELKQSHPDDSVLIVSHGSFLRVLLAVLFGCTVAQTYEQVPRQKNTSLSVVNWNNDVQAELLGDITHLAGLV